MGEIETGLTLVMLAMSMSIRAVSPLIDREARAWSEKVQTGFSARQMRKRVCAEIMLEQEDDNTLRSYPIATCSNRSPIAVAIARAALRLPQTVRSGRERHKHFFNLVWRKQE